MVRNEEKSLGATDDAGDSFFMLIHIIYPESKTEDNTDREF